MKKIVVEIETGSWNPGWTQDNLNAFWTWLSNQVIMDNIGVEAEPAWVTDVRFAEEEEN